MPPRSKVCRVCLSADVTLCKIADTPLQYVYEKLTNSQLVSGKKPTEACYVCYADLNKCHMVMVNAIKANNVLAAVLERSAQVKKKPESSVRCLTEHRTDSPVEAAPSDGIEIKTEEQNPSLELFVEPVDVAMECEVLEESLLVSDDIYIPDEEKGDESDPLNIIQPYDTIINNEKHMDNGQEVRRKTEETPRINIEKHMAVRSTHEKHVTPRHTQRETNEKPYSPRNNMSPRNNIEKLMVPRNDIETQVTLRTARETNGNPHSPKNMWQETNESPKTPMNNDEQLMVPRNDIETQATLRTTRETNEKPNLPRNIWRETSEKPIVCHICRCTFKHISNLKKHLLSHSGIKYACHICKRIFSSRGSLKVHIRRTHSD